MSELEITDHNSTFRAIWISVLASVLAGCVLAWGMEASAHTATPTAEQPLGWAYGFECCSLKDCREVADDAITEGPDGFVIKATGEKIPYNDKRVKQSKDQFFHLCTVAGKADGKAICIYVPNRGF